LLGSIHLEMKRFDLAEKNLKKAARLEKCEPEVLIKLATALVLRGKKKEAAQVLRRVLAIEGLEPPFKELAAKLTGQLAG
jgi:Flp pilus assembly protein TadD